jgi:microcystin-dependent protein
MCDYSPSVQRDRSGGIDMSDAFVSEIRLVAFNYPPRGWAFCNGQLLPINQNQTLFSLLGTQFGGDGRTTFALPDLRGRVPMHFGKGRNIGQRGGEAAHALTTGEMPAHTHELKATTAVGSTAIPGSGVMLAASKDYEAYRPLAGASLVPLHQGTVAPVGGQPHQNMQPFLTLSFCIALRGVYPSRN